MVQRVVYVPFSSMRSVIDLTERPSSHLKLTGEPPLSGSLPYAVPRPQFTQMPEQDLSIWSLGLLFESLVSASRDLLRPSEPRLARIRKHDRA